MSLFFRLSSSKAILHLTNTDTLETIRSENEIEAQERRGVWDFIGRSLAILWKDWPRNMECTVLSYQNQFSLTGECPHEGRPSVFTMAGSTALEDPQPGIPGVSGVPMLIAPLRCSGCRKWILAFVFKHPNNQWKYYTHYPLESPEVDISEDIPKEVRADLEEALKCRWAKTSKAPIVMCRRALETACDNLLGEKTNAGLRTKIDKVADKGIITNSLKEWARRVQLDARAAAHPQEDGLDSVIGDDADAAIEFTQEFLEHVYVMPAKLKRAVERAEQKKKSVEPASSA